MGHDKVIRTIFLLKHSKSKNKLETNSENLEKSVVCFQAFFNNFFFYVSTDISQTQTTLI